MRELTYSSMLDITLKEVPCAFSAKNKEFGHTPNSLCLKLNVTNDNSLLNANEVIR